MNIYHVGWVQDGAFGLNAVVIAVDEKSALLQLGLDDGYNHDINTTNIGITNYHPVQEHVVCQECL
jgi:hypothetical protein